jgi:hypothetical protein
MTSDLIYVVPFKSRGRLFVEIPEYVEKSGQIVAGEPLQLELIREGIVYHKTGSVCIDKQTGHEIIHRWQSRQQSSRRGFSSD